jgi:hypothetical protein
VKDVDVIELEAEVINANRVIRTRRTYDPFADPRVRLVTNDARNALRLTDKRYDAIVSQPSHPWTAGASHLFTREFFALVRNRLNTDGVFVQWMNAEFLDENLLRRLVATLLAEFRYVRIYQPSALALHFVASNEAIAPEAAQAWLAEPDHYAQNGIAAPTDLVAKLMVNEAGAEQLAAGSEPMTDDDNRMAFDTVTDADGIDASELLRITADVDPLLAGGGTLRVGLSARDAVRVGWRLAADEQTMRLKRWIDTVSDDSTQRLLRALLYRSQGQPDQVDAMLSGIDAKAPLYAEARFLAINNDQPYLHDGVVDVELLPEPVAGENRLSALLLGWQLLGREDWKALEALDAALQAIGYQEIWSNAAVMLRVEWRLSANDPTHAVEAIDLLDRVLASLPSMYGYRLRALAGYQLNNGPVLVESAAYFAGSADQRIWDHFYADRELVPEARERMHREIIELESAVENILADDQTGRARRVHAELQRIRRDYAYN